MRQVISAPHTPASHPHPTPPGCPRGSVGPARSQPSTLMPGRDLPAGETLPAAPPAHPHRSPGLGPHSITCSAEEEPTANKCFADPAPGQAGSRSVNRQPVPPYLPPSSAVIWQVTAPFLGLAAGHPARALQPPGASGGQATDPRPFQQQAQLRPQGQPCTELHGPGPRSWEGGMGSRKPAESTSGASGPSAGCPEPGDTGPITLAHGEGS